MQLHLTKLEVAVREGHAESGKRDAKRIRIALELLRRILRDDGGDYWDLMQAGKITRERAQRLNQRDWDMFWNLCRRQMHRWWD